MYYRRPKQSETNHSERIKIFLIASGFITFIIIGKLFQLQVLAHDYYQGIATSKQYGYAELPAQRGEIIIKDHHSQEEFLLATNTTFNLLFADPYLVENPVALGEKLAPVLFNLDEERAKDQARISELAKLRPANLNEEEINAFNKTLEPLSDFDLEAQHKKNLIETLGQKQRDKILLVNGLNPQKSKQLQDLGVAGLEVNEGFVYAYPKQISNLTATAEKISEYVEIPADRLQTILQGKNRYVVLKKKMPNEMSNQISQLIEEDKDKIFRGIGMTEEYYRFYPEKTLASNVVGYLSKTNIGQYGVESSFNTQLSGKDGKFQTKLDSRGRQITVGDSILEPAVDGDDIVLTIDRSIQMQADKIIEEATKEFKADNGQMLIMNPKTGAIIAMSHYPTYDPNNFGDVFNRVELRFSNEEKAKLVLDPKYDKEEGIYRMYTNELTKDYFTVFKEIDKNGTETFYHYENFYGPEVYHNKIISWPYEPGSVFKTIAMAIAIDDGDITPNTTYNDSGPIGVDFNVYTEEYDFEIKNSTGYHGLVNMTTVLAKSLNTGMTFIAKRIGPALFYDYMKKFGLLERTDIELDTEVSGKIRYYEEWTESELATASFGQGITTTMIQIANAYSAIINGGILMQPYIVDEIRSDDGTVQKTEPHEIRRVISEETSSQMVEMLRYSGEEGEARFGKVPGHEIGGKTGTSQTYRNGRALSGAGTTIATFAGFGPVNDPQFLVLIKFDKPKKIEWGSRTAAPTFAKIAEYMFDYYNIPPDKDFEQIILDYNTPTED